MGPFTKIRVTPFLVRVRPDPQDCDAPSAETAEGAATHIHVNFHMMSFCPISVG